MSLGCDTPAEVCGGESVQARILWIVLAINITMFVVEVASGLIARSMALQADALDFLADSANYGIALFVLGRSVRWRATTALLKSATMCGFGLYVLGLTAYRVTAGGLPDAAVMGSIGALALLANVVCAGLLYRFREGDSNLRAVWICSRNDAVANLAVIAAAAGVMGTATAWPDLAVALLIAALALTGAVQVGRLARAELKPRAATPAE